MNFNRMQMVLVLVTRGSRVFLADRSRCVLDSMETRLRWSRPLLLTVLPARTSVGKCVFLLPADTCTSIFTICSVTVAFKRLSCCEGGTAERTAPVLLSTSTQTFWKVLFAIFSAADFL